MVVTKQRSIEAGKSFRVVEYRTKCEWVAEATSFQRALAVESAASLGSTTQISIGTLHDAKPCRYREPSWPTPTRRIRAALVKDELVESKGDYGMIL